MFEPNIITGFRAGNRPDGVRLEACWRTTAPGTGYTALHQLFATLEAAMTDEGSTDPAVITISVMKTNLETAANVDKYVQKW